MTEIAAPEAPRTNLGLWLWRVVGNTPPGRWLRRRFLAAGPVSSQEKKGYAFWSPIALAIAVTEILGAASKTLKNAIPWPTISSTVGHLETRWSWVGVIVVGLIVAVAFHAVAHPTDRRVRGREVRERAPRPKRVSSMYDWRLMVGVVVVAGVAADVAGLSKYQLGYTIYGLLAVLGVVVPSILAYWFARVVRFPTLFRTIWFLQRRFQWVAVVLVSGLAILVVHLALYPWPNIPHESAKYGGLSSSQARERAAQKIKSLHPGTGLSYRAEGRGSFAGRDAWLVFFEPSSGFGSGCVVAVNAETGATPSPECSN